jgi:hypothetical protein
VNARQTCNRDIRKNGKHQGARWALRDSNPRPSPCKAADRLRYATTGDGSV